MRQVPAHNFGNILHCASQTVAGCVGVAAACSRYDPVRDDTVYHVPEVCLSNLGRYTDCCYVLLTRFARYSPGNSRGCPSHDATTAF